jgi:hypothetical protein
MPRVHPDKTDPRLRGAEWYEVNQAKGHVVAIDYRFVLAPDAVPGTYAWR